MESTTTAFVGVRLVQRPYPLLVLEVLQHPSIPRPRSSTVYFALLIQFPNSGGACCGPSKSEV
jgi:hypothetical protein